MAQRGVRIRSVKLLGRNEKKILVGETSESFSVYEINKLF